MNLHRLRELVKAWQDGSIREAELAELRDALPEVLAPYKPSNEQRHDPVVKAAVAMGMSAEETLQLVWRTYIETRRNFERYIELSARPAVFVLPSK